MRRSTPSTILNPGEADVTKIDEDVRAALIEQEHRLLAAVVNLSRLVFRASKDDRQRYLPSAIRALIWCLLPSAGTASVSLLAVITLLVTIHQSSLLSTQNRKIEVQNVLAEAQRRSSLMFETVAIFESIEEEKKQTPGEDLCSNAKAPCWRTFEQAPNATRAASPLFVPSAGTVGRLAALTQALRPYRYLQVEGAREHGCLADTSSATLDASYQWLVGLLIQFKQVPEADAKQAVEAIYARNGQPSVVGLRQRFSRLIALITGTDEHEDAQLSCGPSSPERGQLLVALHAAGVDISTVQAGGGNFTYADIPGANLGGIRLQDVNLNNTRLPGASFADAVLHNVQFRGADLNGARFSGAAISKSDFEGARLQVFEKVNDAPWFFLPASADDVLLSGVRLFEENAAPQLKSRMCSGLQLPTAFTLGEKTRANLDHMDAGEFGLLIETRKTPDSIVAAAVVTFALGLPELVLYKAESEDQTSLSYLPFSACP
ncbi:MAG: pentapeptide repeat-containing protein [Pseudomonadota bacterium]